MTKRIKKIFDKKNIFFACFGLLLVISYTLNPLLINNKDLFYGFERQPEGLVLGRLVKAQADGVMSDGGLTGINYNATDSLDEKRYTEYQSMQHDIYLTGKEKPDSFYAYKSQSGGQAITLALLAELLPVDNLHKLAVFRLLNAILVAGVFILFAMWVSRNHGFIASIVTLVCVLFSPWLNMYAHSLWWVLWNFYLPMIAVLLVCERDYNAKRSVLTYRLLIFAFLGMFLKCWFTGFEFITTTLVAAFVPFIYYSYLSSSKISKFILSGLAIGVSMMLGVLLQMGILILQVEAYTGVAGSGLQHIVISFTKRTSTEVVDLLDVIVTYFQNDFLQLGFLSNQNSFYFGVLLLILICIAFYLLKAGANDRKLQALIVSFFFSFLAPFSWLIIFKQHAWIHQHMDYIVWYIPTLLYGYTILGVGLDKLIVGFRNKDK